MLNMNLQIFAHKKGVGSTKNGRDFRIQETWRQESGRTVCEGRKHSLQTERHEDSSGRKRWTWAVTTLCSHWLTVLFVLKEKAETRNRFLSFL